MNKGKNERINIECVNEIFIYILLLIKSMASLSVYNCISPTTICKMAFLFRWQWRPFFPWKRRTWLPSQMPKVPQSYTFTENAHDLSPPYSSSFWHRFQVSHLTILHLLCAPPLCTSFVHLLRAPPSCTSFVQLLRAPPSCTSFIHLLRAPASCTSFIHLLRAPPSCTSFVNRFNRCYIDSQYSTSFEGSYHDWIIIIIFYYG